MEKKTVEIVIGEKAEAPENRADLGETSIKALPQGEVEGHAQYLTGQCPYCGAHLNLWWHYPGERFECCVCHGTFSLS